MRVFGEVKPKEVRSVLLMLANIFALLVGYYIIKTVREPLVLASGGAIGKAWAAAAQAVALIIIIPVYSWLSSRVDRRVLITIVTLFFVGWIEFFFITSRFNLDRTDPLVESQATMLVENAVASPGGRFDAIAVAEGESWSATWRYESPGEEKWALFIGGEPGAIEALRAADLTVVGPDGDEIELGNSATEGRNWPETVAKRFQFDAEAGEYTLTLQGEGAAPAVRTLVQKKARAPWLGFLFYVWVGIFNVMIIAQFWSYANDIYSKEAGRRLFAVIAIGATGGAWVGSALASMLFSAGIDPYVMLQITAALLVITLLNYFLVEAGEEKTVASAVADTESESMGSGFGFDLVFKNGYILLIALLLMILNLVNTTGEYVLSDLVNAAARAAIESDAPANPDAFYDQFVGGFYGRYFFVVNAAALILQALVASRLVKYFGLRGLLLAMPIIAFGAYGIVAMGAGLGVVRWAKTAENSSDYSLMNTAKAMLWLPTTREEKYKAKQAVDTFFVRTGDLLALGLFTVGTTTLSFGARQFALVNLCLIGIACVIAFALLRRNRALAAEGEAAAAE